MTPLKRAELAILQVARERGVIMGCVAANHMAIEVLSAIREPSEAVLKAMRDTVPVDGYEWEYMEAEAAPHWQAMIDAILAEEG